MPDIGLLRGLDGALRTVLDPAATDAARTAARETFGEASGTMERYATGHREALSDVRLLQVRDARDTFADLAEQVGPEEWQPYGFASAWAAATLVATDSARALPGGHAGIDLAAISRAATPDLARADAHDGVASLRAHAFDDLLGGYFARQRGAQAVSGAWPFPEAATATSDVSLERHLTTVEQLRAASATVADMGMSAAGGARAKVRTIASEGYSTVIDGPAAPTAAELAAAPGSATRLHAVTSRMQLAVRALTAGAEPVRSAVLDTGDAALREQVATLRAGLDEIEQHAGLPELHELAKFPPIDDARAQLSRLDDAFNARNGQYLGDLLDKPAPFSDDVSSIADVDRPTTRLKAFTDGVAAGVTERSVGGVNAHRALLDTVTRAAQTPTMRMDELGPIVLDGMQRIAAAAPTATPLRRGQLQTAARTLLGRLDDAAESGRALPNPMRKQLAALVSQAERQRWEPLPGGRGRQLRDMDLWRPMNRATYDLLQPGRTTFAREVAGVEHIGAHATDVTAARAALTERLAHSRASLVLGKPERRAALSGAYERSAAAIRARQIEQGVAPDGAASTAAQQLVERAQAHMPSDVARDASHPRELLEWATTWNPSPAHATAAIDALLAPGASPQAAVRAGAIEDALARISGSAADVATTVAGSAPALRASADRLAAATVAVDGEAHVVPDPRATVGALSHLVTDVDAVDPQLRTAITPHLTDDLLSELGRALRADERQSLAGHVADESLWPDRGTIGHALVDTRTLADVTEMQAAAPDTI